MTGVLPTNSAEPYLAAVHKLADLVVAARLEMERERSLPAPLVAQMLDDGFFSLWLARAFGGPELGFDEYARVIEAISALDGSVGWCCMVTGALSRLSGYLPDEVAHEIFREGRSIVAGSINPTGRAVPVEGGYRVTGRWSYGSFIAHSDWGVGNTIVLDGDTPRRQVNGAPDIRFMIVPRAEIEIIDNWHVAGLRATGSCDFEFRDVFVPEDRSLPTFTAPPRKSGALYATPLISVFAASIPLVSIGIARCAIDAFVALAENKTPMGGTGRLKEKATVQAELGRAEASLRSGRAFLLEAMQEVWEAAEEGDMPTMHQRAIVRIAAAHAAEAAVRAVDLVWNAAGGTALFESCPIERCFRDVHATTQHIGTNANNFELGGRVLLGLDPGTPRF